jgi:hypothetical protein
VLVEWLKVKVLSSNSSTAKKKKKESKRERQRRQQWRIEDNIYASIKEKILNIVDAKEESSSSRMLDIAAYIGHPTSLGT